MPNNVFCPNFSLLWLDIVTTTTHADWLAKRANKLILLTPKVPS